MIRELLDAAVQAATAMHIEPWAFVLMQDKLHLKALLRPRESDAARAERGRRLGLGPGSAP